MKGTYIHNLFGSFKKYNISTGLFSAVTVLTIIMKTIGGIFNIKDHLLHPQFTEVSNKDWFFGKEEIWQLILYWTFFIVDFLWAPLLLLMLYKFIKWKTYNILKGLKWVSVVFAILAATSLVLDYIENFYYLGRYEYPDITSVKNVAYGITFFVFIVISLLNFKKKWLAVPVQFVKSSWISLLILFILGLTLPKVPQFNSVIVRLYYNPFEFTILFLGVFTPLYAIVLSHYPSYISLSKQKSAPKKRWRISHKVWIFGTIWYKEVPLPNESEQTEYKIYQSKVGYLRRVLGILFYAAVFFLLAYTADTNFDCCIKFSAFTPIFILFLMLFLHYHKKKYGAWRKANNPYLKTILQHESFDIYYKNVPETEIKPKASLFHICKPARAYTIWLCISVVLLIVLLVALFVGKPNPYNITTVIISLVCIVAQSITYIYYRTYRTAFKYVFFNPKQKSIFYAFDVIDYNETKYKKHKTFIENFFTTHDFKQRSRLLKVFSKLRIFEFSLGSLSNNVVFLKRIIYLGFANSILLVVLNCFNLQAVRINSAIIILSYFFLFYGIIIIIIKHIIYYSKSDENFAKSNKVKFTNTMIITALLVVVFNGLARFNPGTKSELYVLEQIDRIENEEIDLTTFVKNLKPGNNKFYIGCYGGGIKANAWTMTVLDTLSKEFNIMQKATCLSGASGGTIGLINYATIYNQNPSKTKRTEIVRKIATENILSIDLTHFFGRDLIGHLFIPSSKYTVLKGKDRSTAAMIKYATHANYTPKHSFKKLSYRDYWKKMYNNKGNQLPILIANSTNIKGRQGMAVSVKSSGNANRLLYAGADDILELDPLGKPKTLSYYNAASTTNRFPFLSPAATIKGKGQYNDGGIYENSGLLSAYKLYEAINTINDSIIKTSSSTRSNKDSTTIKRNIKTPKNVFVNIVNDKKLFIKSYVNANYDGLNTCFGIDINESNEISAILNSVSATEMLPSYIKEKLEYLSDEEIDNIKFISIYLPHQFDLNDIKRIYKPEIVDTMCVNKLDKMITENDDEIKKALNISKENCKPIVEPELSRVMAKPAHDFMLAMREHPYVAEKIKHLGVLLSED